MKPWPDPLFGDKPATRTEVVFATILVLSPFVLLLHLLLQGF